MLVSRIILTVEQSLDRVLQALDHRISVNDNWDAVEIEVLDTGLANVEFTVEHNLGRVPKYYIANLDVGGVVYDSDRANWTPLLMKLKCTVAAASLRLIVL